MTTYVEEQGGVVRIAGRAFATGSAISRGLINADLSLTPRGEAMLAPVNPDVPRSPAAQVGGEFDPEAAAAAMFGADGQRRKQKPIRVLRPRNVTADGQPVDDEETLAAIAARTAGIEAAAKAEREV